MHVDNNSRLIFIYQHKEMLTGWTYVSFPSSCRISTLFFSSKEPHTLQKWGFVWIMQTTQVCWKSTYLFCLSHSPGTLTMPIALILWVRWDRKVGFQPGHSKVNDLRLIIYLLWPLGRNHRSTGPLQILNCVNLQMDQCA